jgi:soluble lytic murein transglycosylase-like protein
MRWLIICILLTTQAYALDIPSYISNCNKNVKEMDIKAITKAIHKYSKMYDVPADLIASVIAVESNFNKKCGLMQVRPHIWMKELKENKVVHSVKELKTIDGNIKAGTYILKKYDHNVKKYNGGGDKHYTKKVRKHRHAITKRVPKCKSNKANAAMPRKVPTKVYRGRKNAK